MSDDKEVLSAVAAAVTEAADGVPADGMMDIEAAPLGTESSLDILARRLPKSELHLHFEGAIPPATVGRLARRAGMPNPAQALRPDSLYDYRGFSHFIDGMRDACALMVDDDAVIEAALDVFARGIDAGARHIELMTTLAYHIEHDREPRGYLAALGRAFEQAAEMWGMSGGIIVEFDRPAGPGRATEIANIAADAADAGVPVLAVGNDGDPLTMPFRDLAPAYEVARKRGLKLTGHADLPDDITAALELGLDRIDHGFFAIYDQGVMDQLVAKQIPMTLCITSNVIQMPGLYADFGVHPLKALVDAGCNVTLNTDDPPMFYTDLAQEYRAAARALGWGPKEMGDAARRSLRAGWITADRDARLAAWEREIEVLVEDPRASRGQLL
ncbi:MAG: hypothetical protein WEB06_21095 [Actinomycetota bacterium]